MIVISHRTPETLKPVVEEAYKQNEGSASLMLSREQLHAVEETFGMINRGHLRVAKPVAGGWETQVWAKQAILLYFRSRQIEEIESNPFSWVDKIPVKRWTMDMGIRIVPPAVVRFGAYVAKGCVLMPSYVNVGAYVDEGTMVDTWATVGSCAQIGKNVHLSGGVGIGGVLEPAQAQPVIVEDECFIGSRAVIVEGVMIKKRAVIGAGVVLTASTPIIDVRGAQPVVTKGVIPENCVVIPGSAAKKFPAGQFNVPCALIIGARSASTDQKTSLNQALREFDVPV
jgi:2,3,4,5-tetrahydropyridine-2-carboxylate N-succinyltransferase